LARFLNALVLALVMLSPTIASAASALDPQNTLIMDTTKGRVVIQLRPDLAPNHVARVKTLTKQGFYNGTPFHRVVQDFMAQGGDPTGTGMGGSPLPNLKAEFTNANFGRGAIGAARGDDPDSANSQFFICNKDCSFLNGQYTLWGQVVKGMDVVDQFKKAPDGVPIDDPDKIIKMQIAADAK
jgi:peptidylprolyl isomerase